MADYPTSLDSFANPTSSTYTDDPGFELDALISGLGDVAEALEAKVGTGASTPTAGKVLRATGTGASAWGQVATGDIAANATSQVGAASGSTANPTTSSTTPVTIPEMSVALTFTGGSVVAFFEIEGQLDTAGGFIEYGFYVDGALSNGYLAQPFATANSIIVTTLVVPLTIAAGAHTVTARWNVLSGAQVAKAVSTVRYLTVLELKK